MKLAALLIATILIGSCASVPNDPYDGPRFELHVENQLFEDVTFYLLNGGIKARLKTCHPIVPCRHIFNEARTESIERDGYIAIGWTLDSYPPGMLTGRTELDLSNRVDLFLLTIDRVRVWLRPGWRPAGRST